MQPYGRTPLLDGTTTFKHIRQGVIQNLPLLRTDMLSGTFSAEKVDEATQNGHSTVKVLTSALAEKVETGH